MYAIKRKDTVFQLNTKIPHFNPTSMVIFNSLIKKL